MKAFYVLMCFIFNTVSSNNAAVVEVGGGGQEGEEEVENLCVEILIRLSVCIYYSSITDCSFVPAKLIKAL